MLTWSDGVGPDALDRCLGVRKDGEAVTSPWPLIESPQGLVGGENLGIENLLIVAQVEAAIRPAAVLPLPHASSSHLSCIETRSVRPNGAPGPPTAGSLKGRASLVNPNSTGEGTALAPDLWLDRLPAPGADRCSDPGGKRRSPSSKISSGPPPLPDREERPCENLAWR